MAAAKKTGAKTTRAKQAVKPKRAASAKTAKANGARANGAKRSGAKRSGAKVNGARGSGAAARFVGGDAAYAEIDAFEGLGDGEIVRGGLRSEDRQLLTRVARFLATVVTPALLRRAVSAGYSREEHEELWRMFLAGSARDQPLAFAFAEIDGGAQHDAAAVIAELDAFENEWFPKTRAIVERRVPPTNLERFRAAFFKDLSQQPVGPLVIDSVATYLDRVEALGSSSEPGAAEVHATLRSRGLDEARIASARALVAKARSGGGMARQASDAEAWRAARERQAEALRTLRLAWNDWGATLRPLYGVREQVQLGFAELRLRTERDTDAAPSPVEPAPV